MGKDALGRGGAGWRGAAAVEPRRWYAAQLVLLVALVWQFGPYADGTWRLILNDGEQAYDVPRESAYRIGTAKQLALRSGYRSPQGWVTYSPEIALDFTRQTKTTWRR